MPKMGLVLQGGGAFGAYEYGAVTRLVELGWHPIAVTGVSIGLPRRSNAQRRRTALWLARKID